jgi:hypothetical protein
MSGPRNPNLFPDHPAIGELADLAHMNPTIIPVGIAVGDLALGHPFIPQQVVELTGLQSTQVHRNIKALRHAQMIERRMSPDQNHHLRPYTRVEHLHWQFFSGVRSLLKIEGIDDLFGKTWEDVDGWLRYRIRGREGIITEEAAAPPPLPDSDSNSTGLAVRPSSIVLNQNE